MTPASGGWLLLALAAAGQGAPASVQGPPAPEAAAATAVPRPAAVSPQLFAAVERATEQYPSIRAGRSQVQASKADVRAAKNLRLPSVGVQGVALGTGGGLGSQLVVDQPIFSFGRLEATIDRAKAQRLVREAEVDEIVQNVALDTVTAYFEIARLAKRQAIMTDSLEEHRLLVGSIGRRVEQEVSPQSDLELARSRTAQLEQELALVIAQRQAATARLYQLVGDERYDAGNVPQYDPAVHHPDPTGAVEQAIGCSPRRQRLSAQTLVARAETKQARRSFWPQLSAQYSYNNIIGSRAGVAVTAQTTGGLSNLAAADAARARETSTALDVSTAERELRERLANDLVENAAARGRIASGGTASVSAENVTESFKRQFIAGRRTWLDVMNAVREASSAELSSADAEFSAMASAARILLTTCRWQPQPRLMTTPIEVTP
ncbi:outer membrane protein, adhesin transport system [Sphingomonas guangdongensis]|uniref:Outer membrane protein, adhesin transport system n=1 Tax=Sphingomonas guangdongensis TaxID=1141890 RepID=A0A285QZ23_9SPHN|nr:TolC family protein [Sphingomonas guangdongensis]SOB86824.1 outer membrane protein, adhesin transport system [Sphingomonas guangdongensis]